MKEPKQNYIITKVGNLRYRQLQVGSDYYLLDLDTHIWTWLIPTSVWWFPMRAYKLDKPIPIPSLATKGTIHPSFFAAITTIILVRFSYLIPSLGEYINIYVLFFLIQSCILICKWISSRRLEKVSDDYIFIRLVIPKSEWVEFYKVLFIPMVLFLILLLWNVSQFFVSNGLLTMFLLLVMLTTLYYFFNNLGRSPQKVKKLIKISS